MPEPLSGRAPGNRTARRPLYRERLWPAVWVAVVSLVLLATLAVAFGAALGPAAAVVTMVVTTTPAVWGFTRSAVRVEVDDVELRVGRAHVPVGLLGSVTALDAEATRLLRGRDIDPRAHHVLRGWVPTAVRVDLVDPADPTPYWMVSTRRPHRLVAAIERARTDR